jgi:hypothetical protein
MANNCETCKWFLPATFSNLDDDEEDDGSGECHRHAPRPATYNCYDGSKYHIYLTSWPDIKKWMFCGDWYPL